MELIDNRTHIPVNELPVIENENQYYIYILRNEAGKVKVGQTKNPKQRIQSLSGSNGQGIQIIECYYSPITYLYTLEKIMHENMRDFRINGTEWFYYDGDQSGQILFNVAVAFLESLISSDSFKKCEEVRKIFYGEKRYGKE